MSDPHDELASAWLDGELSPDERARAAADPAVTAARVELDAVRRQLAAPVEVPAEVRERHLAVALESLAVPGAGTDAGSAAASSVDGGPTTAQDRSGATVVPLRRRTAAGVPLLARAAAVLAVVGAVGVGVATWSTDRDTTDDVALAPSAEGTTATSDASAGESRLASPQGDAGGDSAASQVEGAPPAESDGPVAADEGTDPVAVAAAADALLSAGEPTAPGLAAELVERFGPAVEWGLLEEPTPFCAVELDQRHPDAAPHVVLPLGPPRLLVVDADGGAAYVDPTTCEPAP